jgi:hypothetical protein
MSMQQRVGMLGTCCEARDAVLESLLAPTHGPAAADSPAMKNREQALAYARVALLGQSAFLTGGAGVGKTFVVRQISATVQALVDEGGVAVVSPTGAAARVASTAELRAMTCHLFFNIRKRKRPVGSDAAVLTGTHASARTGGGTGAVVLTGTHASARTGGGMGAVAGADSEAEGESDDSDDDASVGVKQPTAMLDRYVLERLQKLRLLIVDEVSMLSSEFVCVLDSAMRLAHDESLPFGGCCVLFVGDLCQLSPVVTGSAVARLRAAGGPWCFQAQVWRHLKVMQLTEVVRQSDHQFASVLNRIRIGAATTADARWLNANSSARRTEAETSFFPSNPKCEERNQKNLLRLRAVGAPAVTLKAHNFLFALVSKFPWDIMPVDDRDLSGARETARFHSAAAQELTLCLGARVRCTRNLYNGTYPERNLKVANGQVGTVIRFYGSNVASDTDASVVVKWDTVRAGEASGGANDTMLIEPVVYKRKQKFKIAGLSVYAVSKAVPLRLAWASTVHCAQGASVDAELDVDHRLVRPSASSARWEPTPGGAYVALSRATCVENVRLLRTFRPQDAVLDAEVRAYLRSVCLL